MTTTDNLWQGHAARLADQLVESGDIRDPRWAAAIASVPRHVLVPRVYRQEYDGSWSELGVDPELVYSATTLVTEIEDNLAISSSTKPDLMVRMLETLDVRDGDRVLEIGTGTGYNAALLSHRLGEDNVYSVDVDAGLVAPTRERLAGIGLRPHLSILDGAQGWPEHAPFNRIIATCSVRRIPWAWAEQLADDGALLADIKFNTAAGNLVLLRPRAGALEGRFTGRWAAFMDLRGPASGAPGPRRPRSTRGRQRVTTAPGEPWKSHREVWMLACLDLPPDLRRGYLIDPDTRTPTASTLSAPDGSWCEVELATHQLRHGGVTPLWDRIESAFERWRGWGEPGWERFGLTVTPERHLVWLDEPARTVAELHGETDTSAL